MFRPQLHRAARFYATTFTQAYRPQALRRPFSSGRNNRSSKPSLHGRILTRVDRWITRLPKFARPPLVALRGSPTSYIVSWAILHELTAIVPLFGLFGVFHYTQWLPAWFAEGKYIVGAVEAIGRWFKKRGWIDADDEAEVEKKVKEGKARMFEDNRQKMSEMWNKGEKASRVLVEFATAYAIVKFLIPVRLVLSAFWAPGFARLVVIPVGRSVSTYSSLLWASIRGS